MAEVVIDSSILIAVLKKETGWQEGEKHLNQGIVSSVNMAEVASYLARKSISFEIISEVIKSFLVEIAPFTLSDAASTGFLYQQTKHLGLSLGDRACLSLALKHRLPVLTADTDWLKLSLGIEVKLIR
jgi:ribonuclease VapC